MKIEKQILEIIEAGKTDGSLYYLPTGQLDRKTYLEVNKVLEALGGKWKGGKTKAHVFENPIDDAIENVILTGEVISRKQELNLFETPDEVAEQLVNLSDLFTENKILEPSAGRGKIMQAINRVINPSNLYWCEIDERNAGEVSKDFPTSHRIGADFMSVEPNGYQIDRVLMNPPFSMNGTGRQTDIDHVSHALKFISNGGILVSVMSPAIKFRTNRKTTDFISSLDGYSWEIIDLPDGAFKGSGTMINTIILKVGT